MAIPPISDSNRLLVPMNATCSLITTCVLLSAGMPPISQCFFSSYELDLQKVKSQATEVNCADLGYFMNHSAFSFCCW